jgi:transketolase
LIQVRTHIGFGSPHKQDTAAAHGEPLGVEEVRLTKEKLGWPVEPPFHIPEDALEHFREAGARGSAAQTEWELRLEAYAEQHPDLAAEFQRVMHRKLAKSWDANLPTFTAADGPMATRIASGKTIAALAARLPEMMGGSADLTPSTFTSMDGAGSFEPENRAGRNMHFGIREHAMGAILNGMALHRGLIPYGATFLIFSDYMRPPIRLAAMNGLPVIYVFTHDSIAMGEDGPTHQPVEQLLGLRSIPGMVVIRPADANETVAAWRVAIERHEGPVALVLTRQKLPVLDLAHFPAIPAGVPLGGYILADSPPRARPDIILIATGSEVHLALAARDRLATEGVQARVVSVPSTSIFSTQSDQYRAKVLPPGVPLLAIEAGASLGWKSYVGPQIAVVGVDTFGASAPGPVVMQHFGFTVENVCKKTHDLLRQTKEKP